MHPAASNSPAGYLRLHGGAAFLRPGLIVLCMVPLGCWTRLTTPKESFLYDVPSEGEEGAQRATVLTAPEYGEILRKIAEKDGPQGYRLVVGIRLNIELYGQGIKELVDIRPDGMIDLPLIGDVTAEGKTIPQLKADIAQLYRPFFQQEPQIIINTARDDEVNGTGTRAGSVAVINPRATGGLNQNGAGVVRIDPDNHLSHVVAAVNAVTTETEWRQIAVIRRSRDQKDAVIILCDIEKLVKYGDVRQDILMKHGDIIFVPIERHTLIQEVWATFNLAAQAAWQANFITDYVKKVEG